MAKFMKFIFSKRFLAVFLGIFQITLFFVLVTRFYTVGSTIYSVMTIISVGIMLYLFERDNLNPAYKLLWIIVMVIFPVSGALFYFLWGEWRNRSTPVRI